MVLGELDSNMHKSEPGPLSYTLHKHKLQCMKKLPVRQETIKILEEKAGNHLSDLGCSDYLLDMSPKARENKSKSELLGPHQDTKLPHSKDNNQQL